jgi:hypothetical protein
MSRLAPHITANDNDPVQARPKGDAVGFRALLRERDMERRLHKLELQQMMQSEQGKMSNTQVMSHGYTPSNLHAPQNAQISNDIAKTSKAALVLSLLIMLGAALTAAYTFYTGQSPTIRVVALVALVWSALWATFLSAEKDSRAMPEISTVIATIAGLGVWIVASREWGLALSAADGAAGFAMLTVITSALLGSRLTLLMSACAGLVWLALYTQFPTINMFSIWLYPLLALVQAFCAGRQDAKFSLVLAMTGAHIWLLWILYEHTLSGDISLLHASAIGMMIGFAHYRLGKAAGDRLWGTANVHVLFGWALAIVGATALQNYWLGQNSEIWANVSAKPFGELTWQIIGASSLALIGIAGIIRIGHRQMSTLGVLFSLATAVAAAALFDQRDMISQLITSELSLPAMPLVGLLIGAAILASAIALCVNGARRKSMVMMLVGLTAIAVQLAILLKPQFWTAEILLLFGLGLLTSLSLAALFSAEIAKTDYAK